MEFQLNITKALDALWAKRFLIILVAVLAAFGSFVFIDDSRPDMYSARSTLYAASNESYRNSLEGMNVMRDYVDIIRSRKVAERASSFLAQSVPPEAIMTSVSSSLSEASNIITITARSPDPSLAMSMANAVADAFILEIVNITAVESVKVLDPAYTSDKTLDAVNEAMKTRLIITAGAVFLLGGVIAAFAMFDTRVAHMYEVTLNGKIELLGVIPSKKI